jgi:hypothetical protein
MTIDKKKSSLPGVQKEEKNFCEPLVYFFYRENFVFKKLSSRYLN